MTLTAIRSHHTALSIIPIPTPTPATLNHSHKSQPTSSSCIVKQGNTIEPLKCSREHLKITQRKHGRRRPLLEYSAPSTTTIPRFVYCDWRLRNNQPTSYCGSNFKRNM